MFKLRPARLVCIFHLASLGGLGCTGTGVGATESGSGTSTSGTSTTPEVPTTGASANGPTSTSTTSTSTAGTGDEPGTSSSGADTTGGSSPCGDGIVDPGEECDDGAGNDDTRFCKEDCRLNVCGDGKLYVGWELCDQGAGNSDGYGSLCSSECMPGARCGDGKLQSAFETCDLGPANGGEKGDEQGILCDASCRALRLRGFVTAAAFTGDLGGLFGADLKCRAAALAAGLPEPGRFHALLSTGDVDAKARFKEVATPWPYVLVTGKKFADHFPALIGAGPLGEGIAVTETGAALYEAYVATNTAPGGLRFSPDQHCQGWTSADAAYKGRVGINAVPADAPEWAAWEAAQWWIGFTGIECDTPYFHLYCLEI